MSATRLEPHLGHFSGFVIEWYSFIILIIYKGTNLCIAGQLRNLKPDNYLENKELHDEKKLLRPPNTDGLINWLRQP